MMRLKRCIPEEVEADETVIDLSEYKIVYAEYEAESIMEANPDLANKTEWDFNRITAEELQQSIKTEYGYELPIVKDTESVVTDKEILIGNTNRKNYQGSLGLTFVKDATITSSNKNVTYEYSAENPFKYVIDLAGNDIYIIGGTYGTTYAASKVFLNYLTANATVDGDLTLTKEWILEGTHDLEVVGCIGDSITQGYQSISGDGTDEKTCGYFTYPAYLQRANWKTTYVYNFGHSARTMRSDHENSYQATTRWQLAQEMASALDYVIIALGTNDSKLMDYAWTDTEKQQFINDFFVLVDTLSETNNNIEYVVSNCLTSYSVYNYAADFILELQAECVRQAEEKGYTIELYDMNSASRDAMTKEEHYADAVHPNALGYSIMAELLDGALKDFYGFGE